MSIFSLSWYGKIISMKFKKVLTFLILFVILAFAVGFCEAISGACDDEQQCDQNCHFVCCGEALLPTAVTHSPSFSSVQVLLLNQILVQELFVPSIEHPPKTSKAVPSATPFLNNA